MPAQNVHAVPGWVDHQVFIDIGIVAENPFNEAAIPDFTDQLEVHQVEPQSVHSGIHFEMDLAQSEVLR